MMSSCRVTSIDLLAIHVDDKDGRYCIQDGGRP